LGVPGVRRPRRRVARQSQQQRYRSRKALRLLESFRMQLCEPVDAALLGEWAGLYTAQLRTLPRARNFFAISRRDILASPHALALWWSGDRLVCGCVIGFDPQPRTVVCCARGSPSC
jgi:hypothetical protein